MTIRPTELTPRELREVKRKTEGRCPTCGQHNPQFKIAQQHNLTQTSVSRIASGLYDHLLPEEKP